MKVLIGGGSGFVGRALQQALKAQGHAVSLVSRKAGENRVTWDSLERFGLPQCDAVVNLAGANLFSLRPWTQGFRDEVVESRVGSTTTLAKAIKAAEGPPKVFVCASGVGYYEPKQTTEGDTVDEGAPPGTDFMARLAVDWEEAAAKAASHKTRVVSMRSGVVLGRSGGAFQQMRLPFLLGLGGRLGSGKQPFPWIHIDDAVGLYMHAITSSEVQGPMNAVAPEIISNADFTKELAASLNRPAVIPAPAFALNLVLGAERASVLLEGQRATPAAATKTGYNFQYPTMKSCLANLNG